MLKEAKTTKTFIRNIEKVFSCIGTEVFKQSDVMECLACSKTKAANVINAMKQAGIITKVTGLGPGRYRFV